VSRLQRIKAIEDQVRGEHSEAWASLRQTAMRQVRDAIPPERRKAVGLATQSVLNASFQAADFDGQAAVWLEAQGGDALPWIEFIERAAQLMPVRDRVQARVCHPSELPTPPDEQPTVLQACLEVLQSRSPTTWAYAVYWMYTMLFARAVRQMQATLEFNPLNTP
jgi:hypothetical protein